MNSFPNDMTNNVLTQDSEVKQRCCKERLRITEMLRESMQKFEMNVQLNEKHVFFDIEPKEQSGTNQVRRLLSKELKERFPQLEYQREPEKDWKPVPEEGCDATIYCIAFKKHKQSS